MIGRPSIGILDSSNCGCFGVRVKSHKMEITSVETSEYPIRQDCVELHCIWC
jgi:hypothetical protein